MQNEEVFITPGGLRLIGAPGSAFIYREIWVHFYDGGYKIQAGDHVLDLGANQGFFALCAVEKGADVWCYEPDPASVRRLEENLATNGVEQRVTVDYRIRATGCESHPTIACISAGA